LLVFIRKKKKKKYNNGRKRILGRVAGAFISVYSKKRRKWKRQGGR